MSNYLYKLIYQLCCLCLNTHKYILHLIKRIIFRASDAKGRQHVRGHTLDMTKCKQRYYSWRRSILHPATLTSWGSNGCCMWGTRHLLQKAQSGFENIYLYIFICRYTENAAKGRSQEQQRQVNIVFPKRVAELMETFWLCKNWSDRTLKSFFTHWS